MSKFCGQCGSPLADTASFCPKCGAQITAQPMPQQFQQQFGGQPAFQTAMPGAAKAGMSKGAKTAIICAIGAVAAGLIILLLVILLSSGYKKPINNYIEALEKRDIDLYVDSLTSGGTIEDVVGRYSESELRSKYKYDLRDMISTYGEDFEISYDIIREKELTDEYTLGLCTGYDLTVKFNIKGTKNERTTTETVRVIKSDGKWSLESPLYLSY